MKWIAALVILSGTAFGQNVRFDGVAQARSGAPAPGAFVAVCTQPAVTTTQPCTPAAPLCFSLTDGICTEPNPVRADGLGNYHFYTKSIILPVTVQFFGPSITPYVMTDQTGSGGAGGGLSDPGANGPIKRTAINLTAPAIATDITGLFSGSCDASHALFGNGTCQAISSGSISGPPNVSTQVAGNGAGFASQPKPIYDTRDWMVCDGNGSTGTDTSTGLRNLLNAIGTQEATIRWIGTSTPTASCRVGNFLTGTNITNDFSGGGSIQLISSTTVPGGAGFVQATSKECGAGTTCAMSPMTLTAGNTLVVADAPYPGFTFKITSITDNCGDFFIHVLQSTAGQPRNQGAWVASSIAGGTCTITATANGSLTTNMMNASEWSGMGPVASPDGKGSSANQNNAGPMTSGAAATTAGSLLVAFGGQPFTAETCTAGAGFTQPAGLGGQSATGAMCMEYQLSSAGGNITATQTISSSANWVYSLIPLKVGSATATIWGGIINPDNHQIFFNGDGATGHGVVDFTLNTGITTVYPEWWGAGNAATAAANTLALQAAVYGAFGGGPNPSRPNGSGLNIYNKILYLTSNYSINDELKFYDVVSFKVQCASRLNSGITQTATNKRIIDGQSVAYGAFYDCSWTGAASSTNALIDLDFNGVATAGDLATQFIDFYNNGFFGSSQVDTGVLISKSGGNAQGSNIYCYDCASSGFTGAAWQIGGNNTGRNVGRNYAGNALDIGYSGDIQGSPLYGIAVYGGGYVSFSGSANGLATMENGFTTQTGYDMYCEQTQGPCVMEHMRSESRKLMGASNARILDSRTINQATTILPGTTDPVGTYKTGNQVTGDGAYYKVTSNSSAYNGVGTVAAPLLASSGTSTTIVDTNQNIAGSVTIGTFVLSETITQATTGSTATVLSGLSSVATITGTLTSGTFGFGHIAQQAVTGITCTIGSNNTSTTFFCTNFSGTADNSHVWTDNTSLATFTPSAAPVFAPITMLVTAATGAPDNSHNWTGGTSSAIYVPTAVPVNVANFTVNGFNGMLVGILAGTNINCYGLITSNTATAITFSGGFLTKYPLTACTSNPDTTSKFIVEPNWNQGTVTDGGMTLVYQNENVIDGDGVSHFMQGTLQDVIVPGGKIKPWGNGSSRTILKNVLVSRPDWYDNTGGNNPQGCCSIDRDWDVRAFLPGGSTPINWAFPATTGVPFNGPLHEDLGTKPLCWSIGSIAAVAANDVCIGGRSDPNSGSNASRAVIEFPAGMLGRPSAFGTDQNGVAMQIEGGLPTGAGTPGNIEFWMAPGGGGSSSTPQAGASVASITPTGITTTGQFTSTKATGTAPLVITSTTPVANLTAVPTTYNHSGTQQTATHIVRDRCTLGTDCSVTLTGSAVFTSSSTYDCIAIDRTGANAIQFAPSSGSAFALTGTGTDTLSYVCVGN